MRQIKFLPDVGNMIKIEAPEDITLGQFIELVTAAGGQIDLNKNILTEKKTRNSLLVPEAIIPNGDISIFATVKDPKGNKTDYSAYTRKELYEAIKAFKDSDGNRAVEHFSEYGNITQVSSADLIWMLNSYKPKKAKVTPVKVKASTSGKTKTVDTDEVELKAAQRSFAPKLTYKKK